jgi:hypothetical protein
VGPIDRIIDVVTNHSDPQRMLEGRVAGGNDTQTTPDFGALRTTDNINMSNSLVESQVANRHRHCSPEFRKIHKPSKFSHNDQTQIDKIIARINHKNAFQVSSKGLFTEQKFPRPFFPTLPSKQRVSRPDQ